MVMRIYRDVRIRTVAAVLALFPPGRADAAAAIAATPVPEATAIRIDGELNEEVWRQAPAISGFKQREPKDGAPATYETEARVAYDSTAIYIAVRAFDPDPRRLVAIRTRRDEQSPSDWIGVFIDSYHDRRSAFEFDVNPAGVKKDAYWFNDGNSDEGWDAVWDVAVTRDEGGWRAEFRIPLSQLRFHPSESATFGLAVVRQIGRLNETSSWPLLSKSASGIVSSFGELTGLRLDRSPKRLEAVPYLVGNVNTQPTEAGNPLVKKTEPNGSVGLDLKYALRPGLTLTATMNPDFGQVEADPAVVNLSAFETFFAERRPFFVEGSGIFRFDLDCSDGNCSGLFYSRRIGRAPRGEADVPDGGFSAAPAQTTILGAAKLTGRAGGFSIGALNAMTSTEHAVIASGPLRSSQVVEPLTSYSVTRARREFKNQSSLGFMMTATNRSAEAETRFLPGQAYTGGIDWDWRLGKRYALQGFWAGSTVRGSAEAITDLQESNVHSFQRPDAGYLELDPGRTSLDGHAGQISFNKIGGQSTRFMSNIAFKSPGFEINDLGYMRRADERTMGNWLQWRHEKPSKYLRSFRINFNQWAGRNFGGDTLMNGGNVNAHALFANNWGTGVGVNLNAAVFDDRATRGGPGAYQNPQRGIWNYLETDSRRMLSGGIFMFNSADRHGSAVHDFNPQLTWRPTSFIRVSAGIGLTLNRDQSQWIENLDDRYIFGRIDQRTVSLRARVNYTVTPALSVQIYAEPFVSAGRYSNFKALADGRTKDYARRFAPIAYDGTPDFNYRSFRTTNVLRWEYKPGSTLFVVWQQGREDTAEFGRFDFHRDFGGVFRAPARNVFLVKWAYWLNL
jgi:hypothetical protein